MMAAAVGAICYVAASFLTATVVVCWIAAVVGGLYGIFTIRGAGDGDGAAKRRRNGRNALVVAFALLATGVFALSMGPQGLQTLGASLIVLIVVIGIIFGMVAPAFGRSSN